MSMFYSNGKFEPYSPFTHVYGDYQIEDVQNTLYYLTSRMRAILRHRLASRYLGSVSKAWNAHFLMEAQYASSLVGWVTLVGAAVEIPFLLRSICARGVFFTVDMRVSISPGMIALLEAEPDADTSPYLLPAPKYMSQWWDPPSDEPTPTVITHDTAIPARIFHLKILGKTRPLTPPPGPEPFHSNNSKPFKLPPQTYPACKFCRYYRVLFYDVQTSLSEAVRHVQATAQFAEWSAAETARRREALLVLHQAAERLGRPLTHADIVSLAPEGRHEGTGKADMTMMASESGSNYLLPLKSGIDWDGISTDFIPDIDRSQSPLSISSSIVHHANVGRTPSPPLPRHLQKAAAVELTKNLLPAVEDKLSSQSIAQWGRNVPAGPPPEGPPRLPSPSTSAPGRAPPLASRKLAVVVTPTAICTPHSFFSPPLDPHKRTSEEVPDGRQLDSQVLSGSGSDVPSYSETGLEGSTLPSRVNSHPPTPVSSTELSDPSDTEASWTSGWDNSGIGE